MPVITVGLTAPEFGKSIAQWVKERTIAEAEKALRSTPNFDRQPIVITDGRPMRAPQDVKPFGKIEFRRRANMADAVLEALDMLERASPYGPDARGHYKDDHVPMINDVAVTGDIRAKLMAASPTDKVQVVNTRVYARKIEGIAGRRATKKKAARKGRKGSSKQSRSGVYRVVLRALVQRYGRTMFFDLTYVKLGGGVKVSGKSARRGPRDQVYPALRFVIKPGMAGPAAAAG